MGFFRSAAGLVSVELTSADFGASFQAISERNIPIYQVRQIGDLTTRFTIRRADYTKLAQLCEKRGETLRLCARSGLYWLMKALFKRPVLLVGLLVILLGLLFLPTRVLFVCVEGNVAVPSRQILAAAENSGIRFMASRREVRSEKVKNALLSAVPALQWAGVNTRGCVAVISVRERSVSDQPDAQSGVSSIVAASDGIIDEIIVTQGNALCSVGQAVREGQVLISGYTDCGIFIRAARAEGEVYAQTHRKVTAVCLSQCIQRGRVTDTKRAYSLLIGKKRINLWKDSGIWDTTCGRIYEEYYITLPGGFSLPVGLAVDTYTVYDTGTAPVDQQEAGEVLCRFAERYVISHMVGGRILEDSVSVFQGEGIYCLESSFLCHEMIGRVQQEKIGE